MKPIVLSLFDESAVMVRPWADAGFKCVCVDLMARSSHHPNIRHLAMDVKALASMSREKIEALLGGIPRIIFGFVPCTNTAVSGARWFKKKGYKAAAESFGLLAATLELIGKFGCAWMIENPVSTFSSWWRKPDFTFHPWQFGDGYDKRTCLWAGGGFVPPTPTVHERPAETDQRIHRMPPGPDRARLRSQTPPGFAGATFLANQELVIEEAAA